MKRPTPETDALITARSGFGVTDYEWRQHSRNLERQRNEAREQLDRICRDGFGYQDTIGGEPCADYVLRKLKETRELARELMEALALSVPHLEVIVAHNEALNGRESHMDRADLRAIESALTKAKEVLP